MSANSNRPISPPSVNELIPSIGSSSSDPPSLPNELSSSGNTSDGPSTPSKGLGADDVPEILSEQGEVWAEEESGHPMAIHMLPDNVLLEIFDLCRKNSSCTWFDVWGRNGLTHVCQRWRRLIFGSPRRLNLQLHCTRGTPVRKNLGFWPPFPISICYSKDDGLTPDDDDSILAALQFPDRVCKVHLRLVGPQLVAVAAVMQQPFPTLTRLILEWEDRKPPALPNGFLGGSAPCLRHLHLEGIHLPTLPILLSSTSDLVYLHLNDMPEQGVISPEAMVACLAGSPRLQSLLIGFRSTLSLPDQISLPPVTRALLPALTCFEFRGPSKYLEEFASRVDSPRVNQIYIGCSHRLVDTCRDFRVAQLFQFLDRSEDPKLALIRRAEVDFFSPRVMFYVNPHRNNAPIMDLRPESEGAYVKGFIKCQKERQILHVAHMFSQPSALLSGVVHLDLSLNWTNGEDRHDDEWLHLFRQLSAIRTLHVFGLLTGCIARALNDCSAEMVTEVLPVLDWIFIDEQPVSCVEKFFAARQLSGRPVTIIETGEEFYARLQSYHSD